jgi:hypothetical protein
MINRFKGRGLFIFSDPGGAKAVLSLAFLLKTHLKACKIISDREYDFYVDYSMQVAHEVVSPVEEIEDFQPDFIFTGTSYTSSIELEYIKAAKEKDIHVYSFVDHWTSIRKRFRLNETDVLPDIIFMPDEQGKSIAIEEGIDETRLEVMPNPYHRFLESWFPSVSKESFFSKLDLPRSGGKKLVLYAPEPLSNVNGKEAFGFDEISATSVLSNLAGELVDEFYFLYNAHPNQDVELIKPSLSSTIHLVPPGTHVNTLIFYADVVVGFFSNFLLEASILKKPVIRFFINDCAADPFRDKNIGIIAGPDDFIYKLKSQV